MKRLAILFAACLLSGCQYDPYYDQYASTKPTQTLVGTYVLTKYSESVLGTMYKNVKNSSLELRSDSSFTIRNIAPIWSPFSASGGFETVKGQWSLTKHQEWWAVDLAIRAVKEGDGQWNTKSFGGEAMLIGQNAPYKLHFTIGDPDSGQALQYELK